MITNHLLIGITIGVALMVFAAYLPRKKSFKDYRFKKGSKRASIYGRLGAAVRWRKK